METAASSDASARPFGFYSASALVVASMIGAGIFTTTGFSIADLKSPDRVLCAWVLGGALALCGAASYGQLARRMAESGGEYLYLSRALHPLAGFIAGWISLLAGFTGAIAFAATALETYVVPEAQRPDWLPTGAVAIAVVLACALLHALHVGWGAGVQNLLVAVKLVILALFVAIGVFGGNNPPPSPEARQLATAPFSLTAFAMSMVWISLSYTGFNAAVYVAGEVREAERTVPRALLAGTVLVTVMYVLLNYVYLYAVPVERIWGKPDVAAAAAQSLGGETLSLLVRILIALGLLTSVSAMILSGPRVYAKMASDGLFPRLFHLQQGVPRLAIGLQAALAVIVIAMSTLRDLLSYLGFTLSLSSALAVGTLLVPRATNGLGIVAKRAAIVPAAVYVAATVGLAALGAWGHPRQFAATVITVATGVALYWIAASLRRH